VTTHGDGPFVTTQAVRLADEVIFLHNDMVMERYQKNLGSFTQEELTYIKSKSACVVGCGGLGGQAAMTLARFGIGSLTLVDGDVFEESNLNRQVFSTEHNLGINKALAAKTALAQINSEIKISAIDTMLTEANAAELLAGHDIVLDCLDNLPARLILESSCAEARIPFVHGAISGFSGQVCCVFPGENILHTIYSKNLHDNKETASSAPAFAPQFVAAVQCSEALKILTGKGVTLRKQLLMIDLFNNQFEVIDIA